MLIMKKKSQRNLEYHMVEGKKGEREKLIINISIVLSGSDKTAAWHTYLAQGIP